MAQKESYDVLRLIEHGRSCYISSESVQGKTLVKYLKYHPVLEKKELYLLLQEIARQLELIHRCRGNPCYQYVNPYSIIRSDEGKIYYLDLGTEEGKEQMIFMQRRDIREYFLPPDEQYYQRASMELDIYGLGKTFQYVLAAVEPEPRLGRREEMRLQKIISKALNGQSSNHSNMRKRLPVSNLSGYQNVSEIRKQIPTYKEKIKKTHRKGSVIRKMCIISIAILLVGGYYVRQTQKTQKVVKERSSLKDKKEGNEKETENSQYADQEYLDLAMAYFLDVGDEDKSLKYLKKMKNSEVAEDFRILVESYKEQEMIKPEENYKTVIQKLEKILDGSKQGNGKKQGAYYRCLIRGYGLMKGKEGADNVLRLVKKYREFPDEETKKEIKKYEAAAYEKKEEREKAAEVYTDLLQLESDQKLREQLYKKVVLLYEKSGRKDMSGEICRQGMNELKESEELKILYMKIMCGDASVSREACAQIIKTYLTENPKLAEMEEFKKLQKEYEIRREGEEVWVGR